MPITLYDLAGIEPERRFSPFCWRAKMALAHKGLAVDTVPWRFTEKDKLPKPNDGRVPVIVDDGRVTPENLVAIVGKTDGTGFHDDWGRVLADIALRRWTADLLRIGVDEVAARVTFVRG